MKELEGKTLLIMDNSALGASAVIRAKELGIKTIVANFYPFEQSTSKKVADEHAEIDITNTDAVINFIKEKKIDGVFIGWTDSHLPFYAEICKKAKLPACATKEQFEIFSNNKLKFKEKCIEYGVPTLTEYKIDLNFEEKDLKCIKFPVMVKPADGSGGRGVKKCNNINELKEHYQYLYENSSSKKIICEEYIDSPLEIFFNYTFQDGYCSLSACYLCYEFGSYTIHLYSSKYLELYKKEVESKVINMFLELGLKNAVISLQGFIINGSFKFHETGLRMGGGQSYVFTKEFNDVSSLDLMIEYSLTGEIKSIDIKNKDNPYFPKSAVNYYIKTKSGKIRRIEGIEQIKSLPQVLQILTFKNIGDETNFSKSVDGIIYRLHVIDDNPEKLAHTLVNISNTIKIFSEDGHDLQAHHLTYDEILPILKNS